MPMDAEKTTFRFDNHLFFLEQGGDSPVAIEKGESHVMLVLLMRLPAI